jgi:hypothetical protein
MDICPVIVIAFAESAQPCFPVLQHVHLITHPPPHFGPQDHASEVKRVVASLGGIQSVLSSEAKLSQVTQHLDANSQITIAMLGQQASFLQTKAHCYNKCPCI